MTTSNQYSTTQKHTHTHTHTHTQTQRHKGKGRNGNGLILPKDDEKIGIENKTWVGS
jgi:hypothetical protein